MFASPEVSGRSTVSTHLFDEVPIPGEPGPQLLEAIRAREANEVRTLLTAHPGIVNAQDEDGNTALHVAIASGCHADIVDVLLQHRADPAIVNGHGDTCMHVLLALRPAQPVVVDRLLTQGKWRGDGHGLSSLLLANRDGKSALELARNDDGTPADGYEAILPALGRELELWREGLANSLATAVRANDYGAIESMANTAGWELHRPVQGGYNLLHLAIREGSLKAAAAIMKMALARRDIRVMSEPDQQDGLTPLMTALCCEQTDITQMLLLARVPPDSRSRNGVTALHYAAVFAGLDVAKQLIKAGLDADCRDARGVSPIMLAATKGDVEMVKYLASVGGNLNGRDAAGRTPLIYAHLADESPGTVFKLVAAGAKPDAADNEGKTVRDYHVESLQRRAAAGKSVCNIL